MGDYRHLRYTVLELDRKLDLAAEILDITRGELESKIITKREEKAQLLLKEIEEYKRGGESDENNWISE